MEQDEAYGWAAAAVGGGVGQDDSRVAGDVRPATNQCRGKLEGHIGVDVNSDDGSVRKPHRPQRQRISMPHPNLEKPGVRAVLLQILAREGQVIMMGGIFVRARHGPGLEVQRHLVQTCAGAKSFFEMFNVFAIFDFAS